MSGFAGIIRITPTINSDETDHSAIGHMANAIAFRGPDSLQKTCKPDAFFAFSLLTTGPAPQADSQPVSLDGKVWLLGDVRLDRRRELLHEERAVPAGVLELCGDRRDERRERLLEVDALDRRPQPLGGALGSG